MGAGSIEGVLESEPAPLETRNLASRALSVLESNWLGHATTPSPRLYPHQWSWDSACIAMGYARVDQARAEPELRSLFAGQWRERPRCRTSSSRRAARYFPGPEFWQTERSPDAPAAAADVRDRRSRRSTRRPRWRSTGTRARPRPRRGVPRASSLPQARRVARLPLPRAHARPATAWSRSGTRGSRGWTTRRSGTRRSRRIELAPRPTCPTTGASTSSSPTRPSARATASTTATPTSSRLFRELDYDPTRSATRRRSRCSRCSSTRCSSSRTATSPRSRASLGADPGPFEDWAERDGGSASTRGSGTRSTRLYVDYDVRRRARRPR